MQKKVSAIIQNSLELSILKPQKGFSLFTMQKRVI